MRKNLRPERRCRAPSALRWLALGAAALWLSAPRPAAATVIERVVAVIEDRAVLLTDLKARARPYLLRIYQEVPTGAQRAAAVSQVYRAVLERMVDEELQSRAANQAQLTVTAQEVDQALARVAQQNELAVTDIIAEARASGLSEKDYRNELRHQLLEAKLLNLRLQGRVRVSEEDVKDLYRELERQQRSKLPFQIARVVIAVPKGANESERRLKMDLANSVTAQARRGVDFEELARRYSEDAASSKSGGLMARSVPGQLAPAVDRVALTLDVGEVSAPLRVDDQLVIVKVVARDPSSLPELEEARDQLFQRVYMEKMEKARRHWLESLRRRTHVEIRL
jgi:peptidyl-prolyl cis-trans isomerase SurA